MEKDKPKFAKRVAAPVNTTGTRSRGLITCAADLGARRTLQQHRGRPLEGEEHL